MERELGHCRTCARPFTDRRAWRARDLSHEVKYCSDGCRRAKPRARDRQLEERLLALLAEASGARLPLAALEERLGAREEGERRRLMWAATRLAVRGAVILSQGGRAVDPGRARGPLMIQESKG